MTLKKINLIFAFVLVCIILVCVILSRRYGANQENAHASIPTPIPIPILFEEELSGEAGFSRKNIPLILFSNDGKKVLVSQYSDIQDKNQLHIVYDASTNIRRKIHYNVTPYLCTLAGGGVHLLKSIKISPDLTSLCIISRETIEYETAVLSYPIPPEPKFDLDAAIKFQNARKTVFSGTEIIDFFNGDIRVLPQQDGADRINRAIYPIGYGPDDNILFYNNTHADDAYHKIQLHDKTTGIPDH